VQINLPGLNNVTPFNTVKDYEDYLARLAQVPDQIDKTVALMRLGMESGWVQPKVPLRSLPGQIKAQINGEADASPFYTPFKEFPDAIEEADQERLAAEGLAAIADRIKPAYGELLTFVTDEYLPAARDEVGAWSLPDGAAYYAYRVKRMTTTDMTPDEIHELGLREVARIKTGMMDIVKEAGFGADFEAFTKFLRTDDQFYHKTAEDLLEEYRDICKRLNAELPNLFGKLPRTEFNVEAIPDYEAPASTTAYYRQPSADGSRPGTFFANTYNLDQRPTYEMEALSIHEAIPGHHLQIALAQELENVPTFRKFGGFTVFTEGWGLYSESLGEELGFYRDPYSKFGQLSYEMWRAVRLVVDTGMHHKRWTRQQAIDFFNKNTGLSEHNIIAEVDRYIVWPGQALAYKIGELKIKELRAKATKALGDDFDIREFHDTVLEQGSIPLNLLEERVTAWMEAVRRSDM
jgi:prolyl oligopeptidase